MGNGWMSPDELKAKAEETILDGRKAKSYKDWALVLNCIAFNLPLEVVEPVTVIMAQMYDAPLTVEEAREIARYQIMQRTGQSPN